jgi:hypothetical protein
MKTKCGHRHGFKLARFNGQKIIVECKDCKEEIELHIRTALGLIEKEKPGEYGHRAFQNNQQN